MDLALEGKRALITGSSRGLGAAMAKALAAEGAKVIVHGRRAETAAAVAASLGGSDKAAIVLGELSDPGTVERVAAEATAAFGGIDILVNNAGIFGASPWDEMNAADWLSAYATNVVAPARLSALLAPRMGERGWGRLIHVGSAAASLSLSICPNYAATKTALASVSSSLAKQFGRVGVTSNILGVGTIANMAEYAGDALSSHDDPAYALMTSGPDGHYSINTLGRSGTPEDVAFMVTILASPLSSFVNGALIRVDGGGVPTVGF